MIPTPLEAWSLPTKSSATTAFSDTKPLSKAPYISIIPMKLWKLHAADKRDVDMATPTIAHWKISTRQRENLSASLPVKKEKTPDDVDQAISKRAPLCGGTPNSLANEGWKCRKRVADILFGVWLLRASQERTSFPGSLSFPSFRERERKGRDRRSGALGTRLVKSSPDLLLPQPLL